MTIMQYLSTFQLYSPTVLILALGVTLFCSLLKKTVLKNCPKKVFVFLPFVIGLAFYAGFRTVIAGVCPTFIGELSQTLEGGFACGCAATLYYVFYEQFLRKQKTKANPILPLLEGIVPEERREKAAKALLSEGQKKSEDELYPFLLQTLSSYASEGLTEDELAVNGKLIEEFLLTLRKNQQ